MRKQTAHVNQGTMARLEAHAQSVLSTLSVLAETLSQIVPIIQSLLQEVIRHWIAHAKTGGLVLLVRSA